MRTRMQKIVAAITATALAASIMLGGTLAWQSINQEATNIVSGTINPGGRLHDDFDGNNRNKDIYVENFADQEIYARIQLREYLEIGTTEPGSTTDSLVIPAAAEGYSDAATAGNVDTWAIHYFDETKNETDKYVDFTWGGATTYLPTFNMNKDSLLPDINGTYEGTYPDGSEPTGTSIEDDRYSDYIDYAASTAGVNGYEVWDADIDNDDEVGEDVDTLITLTDGTTTHGSFQAAAESVLTLGTDYTTSYTEVIKEQTAQSTHYPTATLNATVISMADWQAMDAATKAAFFGWVYDVDGWAYWSQPIEPKEVDATGAVISDNTTGLLLDAINPRIDDNYYYQIHVIAQFITANDLGHTDGTGFFDPNKGSTPTADALDLLNTIGVNITGGSTLTLSADKTSVAPGGTVNFTATDADNNAITNATWLVNGSNVLSTFDADETVAETTIVDGVLNVATLETATKLTVIAISETDAGDILTGSYDITVTAPAVVPDTYTVEISATGGATSVYAGDTLQLSAEVTKNTTETVTGAAVAWSVDGGADADTDIDTAGILTVGGTETSGTTLIVKAAYKVDGEVVATDTYDVTVNENVYTVEISATGGATSIFAGDTLQLSAEVTKNTKTVTGAAVEWSVDGGNDANTSIGAASGLLSVGSTETDGTELTVKADYKVTGAVVATDTYKVTVSKNVYTITLTTAPTSIAAGGATQTYVAEVKKNGVTDSSGVTWSVEGGTASSISTSGVLTVGAAETATELTVKATSVADVSVEVPCKVTVTHTYAVAVSAADGATTVDAGKTLQFTAAVTRNGETDTTSGVNWSVTPVTTGISISTGGLLSVANTVTSSVQLTVKATSKADGTKSGSAVVTVKGAAEFADEIDDITVGGTDTVTIDGLEWYVLAKDETNNKALLFAKSVLKNSDGSEYNTQFDDNSFKWEGSTLQTYLNDTWLPTMETLSKYAADTTFQTADTYTRDTSTTFTTSTDKVFLLSEADVYGSASMSSTNDVREYTLGKTGIIVPSALIAPEGDGYYLRSPSTSTKVAFVDIDGSRGAYSYSSKWGNVRPALWVNLTSSST